MPPETAQTNDVNSSPSFDILSSIRESPLLLPSTSWSVQCSEGDVKICKLQDCNDSPRPATAWARVRYLGCVSVCLCVCLSVTALLSVGCFFQRFDGEIRNSTWFSFNEMWDFSLKCFFTKLCRISILYLYSGYA